MPQPFDQPKEIGDRIKPYAALTETTPRHDLSLQWMVLPKKESLPDANLASWPNQALPLVRLDRNLPCEQDFNPSLEELLRRRIPRAHQLRLRSASRTVQTCRKDSGVVEYHQVVRPEEFWKSAKHAVAELSRPATQT